MSDTNFPSTGDAPSQKGDFPSASPLDAATHLPRQAACLKTTGYLTFWEKTQTLNTTTAAAPQTEGILLLYPPLYTRCTTKTAQAEPRASPSTR